MSKTPTPPVAGAPIAAGDTMFAGDIGHYADVGRDALAWIRRALDAAGRPTPRSVLDLPCGHGRVLRHLREAYPAAELTACDLDADGVAFCERTFGARGIVSKADFDAVDLGRRHDLVWCGSLFTHLDRPAWLPLLRLFLRHVEIGGLLVLTTHGRWVAELLRSGVKQYGLASPAVARVLADYRRDGFGYSGYPQSPDYGISVNSPAWLLRNAGDFESLRVVTFAERAWDAHQDVLALEVLGT
ncbi:MAG: class I SAM-dependent methyltransferase [Planctomycetes bacterium]|nr:class I SAM-dependent methyltransferase [Planctomycetota bacterium]